MSVSRPARAGGVVLLPVVMLLLLVAVVAVLLNLEQAAEVRRIDAGRAAQAADYALEAALAHGRWSLTAQDTCSAYGIGATSFGDYTYSVAFSPDNGSPVTMTATVTGTDGSARARVVSGVLAYGGDTHGLTLQGATVFRDTLLDGDKPGENHGAATRLQASDARHVLVATALDDLPDDATIVTASLELYATNGSGTVTARPLTEAWVEGSCTDGSCSPADGATWASRDGSTAWSSAGGTVDDGSAVTATVAAGSWVSLDVTAWVREWRDGMRANHGIRLDGPASGSTPEFASSEDSDSTRRPRLVLAYRCACGVDCVPVTAAPQCSADFVPDLEIGRVSAATLGVSGLMAVESVPEEATVLGVDVPAGGGVVALDWTAGALVLAAPDGTVLATHAAAASQPRGVAYIASGAQAGKLAVSYYSAKRVHLHGADGASTGSFNTGAYTSAPEGLAFVDGSASGTWDGTLAIATRVNKNGQVAPAVHLVDVDGSLRHSIDLAAFTTWPNGVAHLPGTDKLLVSDRYAGNFIVDFDGNLLSSYDTAAFALSDNAESAIDGTSCAHLVTAWGSQAYAVLTDSDHELVAHWRLDEDSGSVAADNVGGHDGSVAVPHWIAGQDGNALAFTGRDVQVADAAGLDLDGDFALALWFRYDGANGALLSKGKDAGALNYHLELRNGALLFALQAGTLREVTLGNGFVAGDWHHVVVVVEASGGRLRGYVDGTLVANAGLTGTPATNARDLFFGSSEYEGDAWTGALDDVRLYGRALPEETIAAIYADALAAAPAGACSGSFADDFSSGGYGGSRGDLAWDGDWLEWNENDGPVFGDEAIVAQNGSNWLRVRDNDGGGEGAGRVFDATGHSHARLTVRYRRVGLDDTGDYVAVYVGDPASMTGNEVARIAGPGTDSTTQTLTVDVSAWANRRSGLLFLGSVNLGAYDEVLIDGVSIDVSGCP
ncbi:MAG: DNRLRE domain-containing protein [Gammaproteobacteria bacterium]|nr:DNRLRE domain-containing protein [Gammaproteobacteria bacterium]